MDKKTYFDFDTASATFLDTSKLGISQGAWLKVTKDSPGIVYFKKNLLPFQACRVFKRGVQIEKIQVPRVWCQLIQSPPDVVAVR